MNSSTKYLVTLLLSALVLLSHAAFAHNKVVVIPMSGDDLKPLANIITVAKKNGDFTDPVAAMASIRDASENNPYLLVIAPGVYDLTETLSIKTHVEVVGSGRQTTIIKGSVGQNSISPQAALVAIESGFTSVQDLSIKNTSTATVAIGLYLTGNTGFANSNLLVIASGAGAARYGIYNERNTVILSDVVVIASQGTNSNTGIFLAAGSTLNLSNSRVSAISSTAFQCFGIFNASLNTARISDSQIRCPFFHNALQFGVYNANNSASVRISNSTIVGDTSVRADSGSGRAESYISDSILTGGVTGNPKCSFIFTNSSVALNSSCQ